MKVKSGDSGGEIKPCKTRERDANFWKAGSLAQISLVGEEVSNKKSKSK